MILGGLLLASSLLFDTDGLLVIVMTMRVMSVMMMVVRMIMITMLTAMRAAYSD